MLLLFPQLPIPQLFLLTKKVSLLFNLFKSQNAQRRSRSKLGLAAATPLREIKRNLSFAWPKN
jgi:hypothetical protein